MSVITCGGCTETWTALGAAHCSACHRTFSSVSLFDLHRSPVGDHGSCLDPAEIRHGRTNEPLAVFRQGMWRGPAMTPEQIAARFGGTS